MKKAAVGGGVAAAAWAAPRVEGMRLVPDYAAAQTVEECVFRLEGKNETCGGQYSQPVDVPLDPDTATCGCTMTATGALTTGITPVLSAGTINSPVKCSGGEDATEVIDGTTWSCPDCGNPPAGVPWIEFTVTCIT